MDRSIYRIIDANSNRAREAIRVIEEFCRFCLNSRFLTERAKQLRHNLSAAISKFDTVRLISSRDTVGDVGISETSGKLSQRANLKECFIANCKRLTEALRALSEMSQSLNSPQAQVIEQLRYAAYTLEKDIVLFSDTTEKFKSVRLYVIISSNLPADVISLTQLCGAGGADCIQLRPKAMQDDKLFALAVEFVQKCKTAGVLSIINDRVDVAVASGADGVHLGQNDLPVEQARRVQLAPLIIGKSTHSLEQLQSACREQPTYVSLGPVFATDTKPSLEAVGVDYIREGIEELANTGLGHVAIGGIRMGNVRQVLKAGVRAIAVCSAIAKADNPMAACRALKEEITTFDKE